MTTAEILESARKLGADEQLRLIDSLFDMLDQPDPAIQAAWAIEAQDRLAAFERGDLAAGPVDELLVQMRRRC
jgi:putative addiction module component (TIGR02574 family)